MRSLELARDAASYALGAGSAMFPLAATGETVLLEHLAHQWSGRNRINVVDVGANHGVYASAVRSMLGERVLIDCFEPGPVSFRLLNERFGAIPNVRLHQLGLGAQPCTALLYGVATGSPVASLYAENAPYGDRGETAEVRIETLDRVLVESEIDLLKIDVEGHELAVLQGAQALLNRGAIQIIQFEFGARNIASRTFLKDFVDLLGETFTFYRVVPRGLARLTYRPSLEMFLEETNYAAVSRMSDVRFD